MYDVMHEFCDKGPHDGQVMLEVFLAWDSKQCSSRIGSWLPLQNTTSGMYCFCLITSDHNMMMWIYVFEEKVVSWFWEDYWTRLYIDMYHKWDGVQEGFTLLGTKRWELSMEKWSDIKLKGVMSLRNK